MGDGRVNINHQVEAKKVLNRGKFRNNFATTFYTLYIIIYSHLLPDEIARKSDLFKRQN